MNNENKEESLRVLRSLSKAPEASQRELARELGFSIGKLNYCLKSLKEKGLLKIDSFKKIQINLIIFTYSLLREWLKRQNLL